MLDENQLAAVRLGDGPQLILAGPGSGKTTVITERVRSLVTERQIDPSRILVVTFTKAAAREMRTRFLRLTGASHTAVTFGTFHAVFFQILKHAYHFTASNILREEQRFAIVRDLIRVRRLECEDENEFVNDILGEIGLVKNTGTPLAHYYATSLSAEVFRAIYTDYEAEKKRRRLIDFDDMLTLTKELLSERPDILSGWRDRFRYILIDEFQDINYVQYEIVRLLAAPLNNLFIVGDDDQSIYRFRGAKPELMLRFPADYPDCGKVLLGTNYRCQANVVTAASNLISHNTNRFAKELRASKAPGSPVHYRIFSSAEEEVGTVISEVQGLLEAKKIRGSEIALLFRTNRNMRRVIESLLKKNLPFQTKEHIPNLYEHWIAQDIFAYFALAHGSRERADLLRIMNRPKRYLSRDALPEVTFAFDVLEESYADKPWVVERIGNLERDLRMLSRMNPYAGINYIRHGIGYDEFCHEYAEYRRISETEMLETLDELQEAAKGYKTLEDWKRQIDAYTKALLKEREEKRADPNAVMLSTLHSAKGLEYDVVYLIDVNAGVMPYRKAVLPADLEEERRMVYVGMTRARKELTLCAVDEKKGAGTVPSPYLGECQSASSTGSASNAAATASYSSSSSMLSIEGLPSASSK